MENEVWKDIPGYEGFYQVSNQGNVKGLDRVVLRNKTKGVFKGKKLSASINTSGYKQLSLYKNGLNKIFCVHQLVAMAFLNHKIDGHKLVVDHINDIKTDNRVENLQIVTNRFNTFKTKKEKNTSIYKGVHWHIINKKWMARIYFNKKEIFLGYFEDEFEAHLAYQNKLKEIENN